MCSIFLPQLLFYLSQIKIMEFILLDILVGLNVSDEENYKKYRLEMTPLLHNIGGKFKYDFTIKETLINHSENEINRVVIISFPNLKSKEDFFPCRNTFL